MARLINNNNNDNKMKEKKNVFSQQLQQKIMEFVMTKAIYIYRRGKGRRKEKQTNGYQHKKKKDILFFSYD
jgi:hypothetical protein